MTVDVLFTSGPRRAAIVVHGGAGLIDPADVPPRIAGCEASAAAGAAVLARGGSAVDAVEAAVRVLEDDPLFNAGTGGCLDADGELSFDASIMDGASLRGGGVCVLPPFRNPIAIARAVMERTSHVLLAGEGAARFAEAHGFVRADPAAMITARARERLAAARARAAARDSANDATKDRAGTVGAVARDARGHVAAATSTGGMVAKLPGRVGDSPILGAGTYADDLAGACSTTGHGEAMMRVGLARVAVDALLSQVALQAASQVGPGDALRDALARMLERVQGTGGAVLVARDGAIGVARSTAVMPWAAMLDAKDGEAPERFSGA